MRLKKPQNKPKNLPLFLEILSIEEVDSSSL